MHVNQKDHQNIYNTPHNVYHSLELKIPLCLAIYNTSLLLSCVCILFCFRSGTKSNVFNVWYGFFFTLRIQLTCNRVCLKWTKKYNITLLVFLQCVMLFVQCFLFFFYVCHFENGRHRWEFIRLVFVFIS